MREIEIVDFSDFYEELGIDEKELEIRTCFYRLLHKISREIYDYRKALGMSQNDLAEALSVKQAMISKIESGEYNFSVELLNNIAQTLGGNLTVSLNLLPKAHKAAKKTLPPAANR